MSENFTHEPAQLNGAEKDESFLESHPRVRNGILGATAVAFGVAAYEFGKEIIPATKDAVFSVYNGNEGWVALGLAAAGGFLLAASSQERSIRIRDRGRDFTKKSLAVAGGLALGGAFLVSLEGVLHNDGPANTAGSTSLLTGTNPNIASPADMTIVVSDDGGTYEILTDFNNPSQADIDSGRFVQDARRLEYKLFEMGDYPAGSTLDQVVDGKLDDRDSAAVDNFQAFLISQGAPDIHIEDRWNAATEAYIHDFTDGDPNTPRFDSMPDLRFAGNTL